MWKIFVLVYIVIGVFSLFFTGGYAQILKISNERSRRAIQDNSRDNKTFILLFILGLVVSVLLWPLHLFQRKKRPPKKLMDVLNENSFFQEQKALFDTLSLMCQDGCETDEIPGGIGEFGHTVTNPIPTKTVFGSTSYLARLCAPDGEKVVYERNGPVFCKEISSKPIDEYTVSHPNGTVLARLYLSPYHKKNSEKTPRGFSLRH
jgi:hypothetical protein